MRLILRFIAFMVLIYFSILQFSLASSITNSPILEPSKIPPGGTIKVTIQGEKVKIQNDMPQIYLSLPHVEANAIKANDNAILITSSKIKIINNEANEVVLKIQIPSLVDIQKALHSNQKEITLQIVRKEKEAPVVPSSGIKLSSIDDAITKAGIATVVALLIMVLSGIFIKGKKRLLAFALNSSGGGYSISRLQMAVWTLIACFCLVYVWSLTGIRMPLNQSMLWLLGISGLSGMVAKRKAVEEAAKNPAVAPSEPSLSDFINDEHSPNIYRIQLIIFTVLLGIMAIQAAITEYEFLEFNENYLILMGISNGAYVWDKYVKK